MHGTLKNRRGTEMENKSLSAILDVILLVRVYVLENWFGVEKTYVELLPYSLVDGFMPLHSSQAFEAVRNDLDDNVGTIRVTNRGRDVETSGSEGLIDFFLHVGHDGGSEVRNLAGRNALHPDSLRRADVWNNWTDEGSAIGWNGWEGSEGTRKEESKAQCHLVNSSWFVEVVLGLEEVRRTCRVKKGVQVLAGRLCQTC